MGKLRSRYLASTLLSGAIASAGLAAPARAATHPEPAPTGASVVAQDQVVSDQAPIEATPPAAAPDVVVTGSRIRSSDTTTPAPVTMLSPKTLEDRGFTQVGDALNELPSITPTFARNTGIGNAITVQDFPNLFNLGAGRTLSLVNGRRTVTTSTGLDDAAVDTNIIPTGLLERVDVVQAGGAAVYGSGAMAGVINYVLKKNYSGIELDGQYDISSRGDYPLYRLRGTFGTNFADGRGNVALDVEYSHSAPLAFPDRPASALVPFAGTNPANKTGTDGIPATVYFTNTKTWSSSYNGILWAGTGSTAASLLKIGGTPVQFNNAGTALVPFNTGTIVYSNLAQGGDGVAYNSKSSLFAGLQRVTANMVGHYDLSDNITVSTELLFAHVRSDDPLGRVRPLQFDNTGSAAGGTFSFAVYRDNAYLTPAVLASLSSASPGFAAGTAPLYLGKFAANILPSTDVITDTKTYRALLAVDGKFTGLGNRDFDWSVSFSRAHVDGDVSGWNIAQIHLRNAADAVKNSAGQIVCRINLTTVTDPNCVPINLFGSDNISAAARSYVAVQSGTNQSTIFTPYSNDQSDLLATFGGDIVKLPAGEAKFSLTYEHRTEDSTNTPLEADQLGLIGAQSKVPVVSGSFHTNEFAGELLLPLLGGKFSIPLVRELELNGSYRLVNDSLAGSESVWGAGLRWKVFEGLTLRSSLSRNFRAPTINELVIPQTANVATATNPCSNDAIALGSNPANRAANCLALFTANPGYGAASAPAGASAAVRLADFFDQSGTFRRALVTTGGNPNLQNEISHTFTYGVVIQPRFIPGLTITADHIKLDLVEALSNFTATSFLATCFDSNPQPAGVCGTFSFNPDGTLATAQSTYFNAGYIHYRGDIIDANYRIGLGTLGAVTLAFSATHNALRSTSVTGLDYTRIDDTTQLPEWVFHPEIHYALGGLRVNYSMYYLPAEKINFTDTVENASVLPVAANVRHSISFEYTTASRFSFRVGVNNLTDEAPSFPYSAGYGDIIGRQFFVGVKKKI